MSLPKRLSLAFKAALQLRPASTLSYAWYQLKLRSGLLRLQTPHRAAWHESLIGAPMPLFPLPERGRLLEALGTDQQALIAEADEVLAGKVRLFGGQPQPLVLDHAQYGRHWTVYNHSLPGGVDIRPLWELGRFGWATALARAYHATGEPKYVEGFWANVEAFLVANPPNQGPHWSSAQEVALRLIALGFAYTVFAEAKASSPQRKQLLAAAIAAHAERIPPSLSYARAQDNNHLLSEAQGLRTAARLLPGHPRSPRWDAAGRRLFLAGLKRQISPEGVYTQHSANYQRLMLQLALWARRLDPDWAADWPPVVGDRLAAATLWLAQLVDEASGRAVNLGPNDGAYILPLTTQAFADYRPVLAASGRAFLDAELPAAKGADEMSLWLGLEPSTLRLDARAEQPIRLRRENSWAYLRAARFTERPGHADQLHLDLWWRGHNLARDAGTYLYNASAPWDNALAASAVHNTLTINGRDQMTRASRFLWLDWAQARVLEGGPGCAVAQHNGYRRLGLTHQRTVLAKDSGWLVRDEVLGGGKIARARLHWLLPDWPWQLDGGRLQLTSPEGETISLAIEADSAQFTLVRAGESLAGDLDFPAVLGWFSPTYTAKEAALSFIAELEATAPFEFTSRWSLPA